MNIGDEEESKMTPRETRRATRIVTFLKNVRLVASFTTRGLTLILPTLSSRTKYTIMINQATPYTYLPSALSRRWEQAQHA